MSNESLVSVIIPTYKRSNFIHKSIDSILNQSYPNVEIIIVDDNGEGSQEQKQTQYDIEKYLQLDNVKYIKNKMNFGGGKSRNIGVDISTGEFITFLDDDDEYFKDKIQKQMTLLKNEKVDIVYCGMDYYDENNKYLDSRKRYFTGSRELIDDHLFRPITGTPTLLLRKKTFYEVKGFDDLKRYQDAMFILKLLNRGYMFSSVKECLVKVNIHSGERITNESTRIKYELDYLSYAMDNLDKIPKQAEKVLKNKREMLSVLNSDEITIKKIMEIIRIINFGMLDYKTLFSFLNYMSIISGRKKA